ncbi:dephospho-CoA kinase [Aestuariivirga sp.]|uniref:dephospho-CoA kinase n=1 Tax=Aestuariivirga sp. TaxID=2650926 RepID=UPI0039E6EF87
MIVVGLTGSIAMGKSTTAQMFRDLGIPVFDSDAEVHRLYEKGGNAVGQVAKRFPEAIRNGAVDRARLSQYVVGNPAAMAELESIVHPLVRGAQAEFLERNASESIVVLDIPLLFETGRQADVDQIIVVSAPADVQRERALARPGMTLDKLAGILSRQMPDAEKRARADYVVDSSESIEHAAQQVKKIVAELKEKDRTEP